MALQQEFRKSGDVIANYDYTDLLENVGYVNLYGIYDEADNYSLTRLAVESTNVYTRKTGTTGSVEANFDYEFQFPQLVKGSLYATITIFAKSVSSGANKNTTTMEIFHVRGATETSIGTEQTFDITDPVVDTVEVQYRTTCTYAVDKIFEKGDKLRIEIISTTSGAGSESAYVGFYHDGANRNLSLTDQWGATCNSNLIIQVPFDLGGKI